MKTKIWIRRFLFRWTKKGRAIRQLVQEFGIEERSLFELVLSIEHDSVSLARQVILEAQRKAYEERLKNPPPIEPPRRPMNQRTAGARLASPRR